MQESDTYLMILDEGKEKGIREIILVLGEDRFGPPDESVKASLNDISDLNRLKRIARHAPNAASWRDILSRGPRAMLWFLGQRVRRPAAAGGRAADTEGRRLGAERAT